MKKLQQKYENNIKVNEQVNNKYIYIYIHTYIYIHIYIYIYTFPYFRWK